MWYFDDERERGFDVIQFFQGILRQIGQQWDAHIGTRIQQIMAYIYSLMIHNVLWIISELIVET